MKIFKSYFFWILILVLTNNSCIEPIEIKTITFDDALVIEATITDEFKFQEISLTRTYRFEEDGPLTESNAEVKIIDDLQNIYTFQEIIPGTYISSTKFSAKPNVNYQLQINTNNGRSYSSREAQLTATAQIDSVISYQDVNDDGVTGISIGVNSFNPLGNSQYYRFEYEETYKIIAQYWVAYEAVVISDSSPYQVDIVLKTNMNDQICYDTNFSQGTIQTETTSFSEDRITNFLVRFIPENDKIINHRYSILVKQYVQSQEAYTFYKILEELSSSDNLFSQIQPGFLEGNLFSNDNIEEKVIGFFEVSSVSTKRHFLNRIDILQTSFRPLDCDFRAPEFELPFSGGSPLVELLLSGGFKYYEDLDPLAPPPPPSGVVGNGPYIIVETKCADCTVLGSNIVPDFWID